MTYKLRLRYVTSLGVCRIFLIHRRDFPGRAFTVPQI